MFALLRESLSFKTAVGDANSGKQLNVRHEETVLETSLKELAKARSKTKSYWLNQSHDLARREERTSLLAGVGGSPGECPIHCRI